MVSYLDLSSVLRHGPEVGVVLMRNAPAGAIRTTSGELIGSSLKRMVLNCATSMFAAVEQTLDLADVLARDERLRENLGV